MELLFTLIAELVFGFAWLVVSAIVELVTALVGSVFFATRDRRNKRRAATRPEAPQRPVATQKQTGHSVWTWVFGGVFAVSITALLVVNYVLFEPAANWLAGRIANRTGIEISFSSIRGDIFTGRMQAENVTVSRRNSEKTEYELTAKTVDANASVTSFLWGPPTIEELTIVGTSGDLWAKPAPKEPAKTSRKFIIDRLQITDARIRLHKTGFPTANLTVASLESQPLDSEFAVFDVFFRSNITASLDGHDIAIRSHANHAGGRNTTWDLKDFPASLVGHYVDRAPFNWFSAGNIDIAVRDEWKTQDTPEIDMDWRIVLRGIRLDVPDSGNMADKLLTRPIAAYINGRDKDIDLGFRLVMNKEQFRGKPTLDAAGLWDALLEGMAREISQRSGEKLETTRDKVDSAIDRLKQGLDRLRKREDWK